MASNKIIRFGPVALTTTTTTNILNPPTLTGGTGLAGTNSNTYLILRHVRVVNKANAAAASFALWLGATGANTAGTEVIAGGAASGGALTAGTGVSVAANSVFDWYGLLRVDVADFLVGGAGTATALTIEGEGEIGVV
jgi:hypothetical protein